MKAILFDTFGTLVDWRSSLIDELGGFGAGRGLTADWAAFVDAWRGEYVPSMERVRRGALPWTVLDDLHRASLDALIDRFHLVGLTAADRVHLVRAWHRLRPWPDVVAGLRRLKARYVIAPLSNGNVALLTHLGKFAGLPWDAVFGADLFRHYKPDPETYLGACALLDLPPGEVMMAAAHNADLAAARAAGLRTGFFPRPTEYGPGQTDNLSATGAWDVVAADVTDFATRLGA
ncbi:MAG TPA: haloacid dehalogenase type II [Acetobacteraceae bacterium]|nr:haloacid dehalogenase type II [Acetobacteraceae bacterium]